MFFIIIFFLTNGNNNTFGGNKTFTLDMQNSDLKDFKFEKTHKFQYWIKYF